MYRISYRFLVLGWSAKPLVSAHDRITGTHTPLPATGQHPGPEAHLGDEVAGPALHGLPLDGQIVRPPLHHFTAAFEHIGSEVRPLDAVAHDVSQRRLSDFPRHARLCTPISE